MTLVTKVVTIKCDLFSTACVGAWLCCSTLISGLLRVLLNSYYVLSGWVRVWKVTGVRRCSHVSFGCLMLALGAELSL